MHSLLEMFEKIANLVPEDKNKELEDIQLELYKSLVSKQVQVLTAEELRSVHKGNFPQWYADIVIENEIMITHNLLCSTIETKFDSVSRGICANPVIVNGVKDYFEKLGYEVSLYEDNLLVIKFMDGNKVKENE